MVIVFIPLDQQEYLRAYFKGNCDFVNDLINSWSKT